MKKYGGPFECKCHQHQDYDHDDDEDDSGYEPEWKFPDKNAFLQNNDSIHNYTVHDLNKKNEINLHNYKGKVLLVVNVASFWSLTYQYFKLNALQYKFYGDGFRVLGFPCNQFGRQEPGETAEEILNCLRYVRPGDDFKTNFKLFNKCNVNGMNESKVFNFLKNSCPPPNEFFKSKKSLNYTPFKSNDIRWNFEKFLLDKHGRVMMRFDSKVEPDKIGPFVQVLLNDGSLNDLRKVSAKLLN